MRIIKKMKWNFSNLTSRFSGCSVKKKIGKQGFTLIELLFVVAILGILATVVTPYVQELMKAVKINRTVAEIQGIQRQVEAYVVGNQEYPATLADVGNGTVPKDIWGRPYQYAVPGGLRTFPITGLPLNSLNTYDLYSLGEDGLTSPQLDGAGAADDIVRANDGAFVGLASELF